MENEEWLVKKKIVLNILDQKLTKEELRCLCGSLIARIREAGLELKCKRCKRFHVIPLSLEPSS
ncbi:hypothetical protein MNBD_NITROSPIRAE01-1455 [hydrothermal vent metagenome]|uniref:Uncharacterized protein n=1 Tax=hydrothermal vent metagenome TaxID=652676 RepID=A0A3B1CVL2_9ZZZZ